MEKDPKKPSPHEQLVNLHDSLADDVLNGYIKIDDETNWRAARVVGAFTDKKLSSGDASTSESPAKEWTKRTEDEQPARGKHK